VAFCHGFHVLMSAACLALRSEVHVVAMLMPQSFVLLTLGFPLGCRCLRVLFRFAVVDLLRPVGNVDLLAE
jgi:hypothetical protein